MLLEITTTHNPATDLGYLLHKNPAAWFEKDLSFGKVCVFYPVATVESCTAVLLAEVDPIAMVRNRRGPAGEGGRLAQYVNDRPYVASSLLSVAIAEAYGTALNGRSKDRQELAGTAIPLAARIPAVSCPGGEEAIRALFAPLGYEIKVTHHALDERFPSWGSGKCCALELAATCRLVDLLRHLYILLPVLDAEKHYWVGRDEVDKLLAKGEGWIAEHPLKEMIVRRYLQRRHRLVREVMERLLEEEAAEDPAVVAEQQDAEEAQVDERVSLNTARLRAVEKKILEKSPRRVIDLGCGEGKLLSILAKHRNIEELSGMDVSLTALEKASRKLNGRLPHQKSRVQLFQGALTYCDARLADHDVATLVEVIEHLDPPRLQALERVVFEASRPRRVIVTTPNAEYNRMWPSLPAGKFRHKDHRFEWTRAEFQQWAESIAERFGYQFEFCPVGPEDAEAGPPTQMGVFDR